MNNIKDEYSYLEFEIASLKRFASFKIMFDKLKEVKHSYSQNIYLAQKQNDLDYIDPIDSCCWQDYLDDEAVKWFENTFDFDSPEGIVYWKIWELTAPEIRLKHPFFKTPGNWHFDSMLDAIFNGYYDLIDLTIEQDNQGCLYYQPRAYPFGSSDSLVELIKSFGNKITYNSRHKYNNPIIKSEWDYELAKKLVEQAISFTPDLIPHFYQD